MKKIILILLIPIIGYGQIQLSPDNANIGDSTTIYVTGHIDNFIDSTSLVIIVFGIICSN